jgi:hypothetical protein
MQAQDEWMAGQGDITGAATADQSEEVLAEI